jgi:hypothetical protein
MIVADIACCDQCGRPADGESEELERAGWRVSPRWSEFRHCCPECRSREGDILDRPLRRRA